jgi:hypothetical protein
MEARKINPEFITDDLEIIDIFRLILKSKEKLWTWQQVPNKSGQRPVHFSLIKKVDPIKKTIEIEPTNKSGYRFSEQNDIFLYSRKKNVAIKFKAKWIDKQYIIFSIPQRLNQLSRELAEKISIVEKENEEANKHKRTAPRKKTEGGFVMLIKNYDDPASHKAILYNLYDISSGGMGLKVQDPGEFIKGMKVKIISINGKNLGKSILGEVMSVREMPEDQCFKIGVKFE